MGYSNLGNYGNNGNNYNNTGNDASFIEHISRYVGQTVTVFTTSGGASGCGFTGVLMYVNPCYLRLTSAQGTAPSNPLSPITCPRYGDWDGPGSRPATVENDGPSCGREKNHDDYRRREHNTIGSVVDIPIDRIAAFCHNAV